MGLPFSFYLIHLENVSRSFSFCISALNSPSREWVALSYLLFRIIDTLEDSKWPNVCSQLASLKQLKIILTGASSSQEYLSWHKQLPDNLIPEEQQLITELPLLLEELKHLPLPIQKSIRHTAAQMIEGMCHFIGCETHLNTLITTNQYCFFVAGIVGELLTKIFTFSLSDFCESTSLVSQSIHFGLFLQKINLLKDKFEDELQGRVSLSCWETVRSSIVLNAQEAITYITAIPVVSGRSYRLFCAWSLFIGLASLRWIDKNWQLQQGKYKIPSQETRHIISQITSIIDDNHALKKLFEEYVNAESVFPTQWAMSNESNLPQWFSTIYTTHHNLPFWYDLGILA